MARPRPAFDRLAVWRAFLEVRACLTDVLEDELVDAAQLPLAWYDVLVQLQEAGGRLRMQELASRLLVSKSGITRLVDRLQQRGYVSREDCPQDRRGTFAVLTPEGRSALRRAAPTHLAGIEDHFARHLTDDEVEAMGAAFARILDAHGRRRT